MKKLRSLKFVLMLVVCLCVSSLPVFADNNLTPLDAPSWAKWNDDNGVYATFENVEEAQGIYSIEVYRNDRYWKTINSTARNPIENGRRAMWNLIEESGNYKFRVMARGDGMTTSDSPWSGWSETFEYKKPNKTFGEVQNLHWSMEEPGTVEWDPPANIPEANRESLRYFVKLFKDGEEVWGMYNLSDTSCDMIKNIDEVADYTCKVQAQSRDIVSISSGKWVESEAYVDVEDVQQRIGDELNDIFSLLDIIDDEEENLATASNALAAVERLDIKETAIAVQTDADALSTLEGIEEAYLGLTGKAVKTNISDNTGFGKGDVKVIGAGLNIASASDWVEIEMKKVDSDEASGIDANLYSYATVFEISLKNAVGKLRAPVTIIMPVPDKINPDRLRIMHVHRDGSREAIYPNIVGKKAKFTVTEFSKFVFMERRESTGGSDEPIVDPGNSGGSGGSGGGGGSSFGGSSSSAGTVTTDSKKGQVNSITGIITGSGDGYSRWISETSQTAGAGTRWKLQYADGTFAAGFYVTDEQGNLVKDSAGNPIEQPLWEMVNGAWYAFGADGYIKSGLVFDPALNGWFYQDVNTGMKTGWQQIEGKWYYFNQASDGTKGIMYVSRETPDGYRVLEDGSWDGQER